MLRDDQIRSWQGDIELQTNLLCGYERQEDSINHPSYSKNNEMGHLLSLKHKIVKRGPHTTRPDMYTLYCISELKVF